MTKRVLLAIHTNTFFPELSRVATLLSGTQAFQPVLLFPHFYPTVARDIKVSLANGWMCLDQRGRPIQQASDIPSRTFVAGSPAKSKVKNIIQRWGLLPAAERILQLIHDVNHRQFDNFWFELWYLPRRTAFARRVIRDQQISLVVVGGDLVHYDTANFIQAAHREKRRAVIVPCTMSDEIEMAENYAPIKNYTMRRWLNRRVAPFFPQWQYVYKGQTLLRLPAGRLLAMEALRLAPPRPWINLSGFADAIAVESQAMMENYTRWGISSRQMRLVGSLADDVMHRQLQEVDQTRQKLYREYSLPDRPMLLTAIPPDQLYMVGGRPESDFSQYDDLVKFWLETLAVYRDQYNIIVNLHPSIDSTTFKHWEKLGVHVVDQNVTALLPLCHFFVASVSTIIRWAIACGKPVVNYDVYRYRYNDYHQAPGVITMEKQEEFQQTVKRLATDSAYFHDIVRAQSNQAERWGHLDGEAGHRMLQLFHDMTAGI